MIFLFVFCNNGVVPINPISSPSWSPSVICRERALSWMNCNLYPDPISLTREDSTVPPGSRTVYLSTAGAWPCDRRKCADHEARDHAVPVTLTGIYKFWLYECIYIHSYLRLNIWEAIYLAVTKRVDAPFHQTSTRHSHVIPFSWVNLIWSHYYLKSMDKYWGFVYLG